MRATINLACRDIRQFEFLTLSSVSLKLHTYEVLQPSRDKRGFYVLNPSITLLNWCTCEILLRFFFFTKYCMFESYVRVRYMRGFRKDRRELRNKSRPCYLARLVKSRMYISLVTCEDVTKSQNLACLDTRDFGWPHQDSVNKPCCLKSCLMAKVSILVRSTLYFWYIPKGQVYLIIRTVVLQN